MNDEQARGKPLIEAVREHELNDLLDSCREKACGQTLQFEPAGSNRFLRAIAVPIGGDPPDGIMLLIQDLTELRGLQTMRRELIGNISHEFRTPLAGLKAMVETLQDGALDNRATANDFLTRIEAEVDRLTQLVDELTELSRIETGSADLNFEPVDINALIEGAIAQLTAPADRQQLTFERKLADGLPPVPADRGRISQVLVNLIHNAVKFNRPGGSITVTTRSAGDSVTVEVADTGAGIDQDDLPHIFERFYRADKSRSGRGSGMGLAIAKHIIEAHGGSIRAESGKGRGSTFSFSLPVRSL
jgi:two-component system phosphate regulon sensor histidine kinase PhoR